MNPEVETTRRGLRAPRAAAIAGIVFSVLLISSLLLIEISIPADPVAGAAELTKHAQRFSLAFNLLPYSGVCFLWFVGVFRDRLGDLEDRFLATVFLGSALLFLAMIFTAGSLPGCWANAQQQSAAASAYIAFLPSIISLLPGFKSRRASWPGSNQPSTQQSS